MFGRKRTAKVKVLKHLNTSSVHWCNEAVLVSISSGIGALAVHSRSVPDRYYGSISFSVLELNSVPLVQARLPGCPTCAGMLATGYGIENCDNAELKSVSALLSSDYVDIMTSIDTLTPVLSLLSSGLYVIADALMYPTDGNGHFFWDVPNQLTENPATAVAWTEDYESVGGFPFVGGFPSFLYASQSNERFDEKRVQYYKDRFARSDSWPRAVSYQFGQFMSVLLDGHHKVAAAALLGKEARCINIIPMSAMSYKPQGRAVQTIDALYFSDIEIAVDDIPLPILRSLKRKFGKRLDDAGLEYEPTNLISKPWGPEYRDTVRHYPELSELVEGITLGIDRITDELIAECLSTQSGECLRKLRFIVACLARKRDERLKELALKCGRLSVDPKLMEASFKALAQIKGDSDIESFFIDYLVDHNDEHDILKKIADGYWA